MQKFDACGRSDGGVAIAAECPGGEQEEDRPKALTTPFDDVAEHLFHNRVIDAYRTEQPLFDQIEIRLHGFKHVRSMYFHG